MRARTSSALPRHRCSRDASSSGAISQSCHLAGDVLALAKRFVDSLPLSLASLRSRHLAESDHNDGDTVTTAVNDTIVIGNGALGSAISVELARRGHRVTRLGRANRPQAASTAAGAMLGCFGEVTTSLLASEHGRAKLAMDIEARRFWPEWDEILSEASGDEESLFTSDGTTVILNSAGSRVVDSGNYSAIISSLDDAQEPYEDVDAEAIDWLAPNDLVRPLRALHIPGERSVDSHRLLAKSDAAVLRYGGAVDEREARRVVVSAGRVVGVELVDGTIQATNSVVIAAGVRSLALLDDVPEIRAKIPPMVSGYGVSVLLEPEDRPLPRTVVRTPNRAFACGLHAVPRDASTLYVGATNIISTEPRGTAALGDLQFLIGCAIDQLHTNLAEASLRQVQVGNRPIPADGFPLIGSTGIDGLYLATGTYRDGLHQSPLVAGHIAGMIEGDQGRWPFLRDFEPVRPPLASGDRASVVETTVDHMMATGWEYRWNVISEWPPRIERHLRRHYTEMVDGLHDSFTPPAELVAAMSAPIRARLERYYGAWS